jgi:hypothetical protein
MPYYPNIPAGSDIKSQSQPLIQANFNALEPFSNNYADLPRISSPTITGTDLGVYAGLSAFSGVTELFVKRPSGSDKEFTTTQTATVGSVTESWTRLPSGVLIKWGFGLSNLTAGAGGSTNIFTFNTTFPVFAGTPVVLLTAGTNNFTPFDPNTAYYVYGATNLLFKVWAANRMGSGSVQYLPPTFIAIGF